MSSFTAPLELTPAPLQGGWLTTRDFTFWAGEVPAPGRERLGTGWFIPAGTFTNLGDIPPVLWTLLPRDDPRWAAAFVVHDELCRRRGFPRLTAAAVFVEALLVLARVHQIPRRARWRIWAMYAGVMLWALIRPYPHD